MSLAVLTSGKLSPKNTIGGNRLKVVFPEDSLRPDAVRIEVVASITIGMLMLLGMVAFWGVGWSASTQILYSAPLLLGAGSFTLLPMVIKENVSGRPSRFFTRIVVAMLVSLFLILVVLPLTGIDRTVELADRYTYTPRTRTVVNAQYAWSMILIGIVPVCMTLVAQLAGLTSETLRFRSHQSPRNDTILLDAMGTSDKLARSNRKSGVWHDALSRRYGERAVSVPRSILGALDASAAEERVLRPILGGIYIATGFRETSTSFYVIEAQTINGVIWGGGPRGVHIAVTRGALQRLDPEEIEAMLMNLMLRLSRLSDITESTMFGREPMQLTSGEWVSLPARSHDHALPLLFDVDQKATYLLRNPAVVLRTLFAVQKAGATIEGAEINSMHPGHFFVWPCGGAVLNHQHRDRVERLHRILEVKERASERLR